MQPKTTLLTIGGILLVWAANNPTAAQSTAQNVSNLLHGGAHSPIAIAVGNAEGTRTKDGGYTEAYYGHTDPGNAKHNLGSCSWQHGANSPEEADQKCVEGLAKVASDLKAEANNKGVRLDKSALVNGIDLHNQAPLAAGDYINRLKECQGEGKAGSDAVLCARAKSYVNPATGGLEAPGLGNSMDRVLSDQGRRMDAIENVIK
jgi:hypothetical protein